MDIDNSNIHEQNQLLKPQQQKKRSHGNRRDQRFRRKCRQRGMRSAKIEKVLQKLKHVKKNKKKKSRVENYMEEMVQYDRDSSIIVPSTILKQSTTTTTVTDLNKRKRNMSYQGLNSYSTMPKSASSISILQPLTKKTKQHMTTTVVPIIVENNNNNNKTMNQIYRRPMYLKRSTWMLFQSLSNILNHPLNEQNKQHYIYTRLEILDQKYWLETNVKLWEAFLDIGSREHQWPNKVQQMSQTDNFELCHQYIMNYIEDFRKQINHCEKELTTQLTSYPIMPITFQQVDTCLNEYVDSQRKYLLKRNNDQLTEFQNDINANKLYETIMKSHPNMNQHQYIDQLLNIRQKQMEIFEELLQFEMHILCKFLSSEYDHLENVVAPVTYTPLNSKPKSVELNNKRYKIIQDAKHQWLHISLSVYEIKLQEYNQQYEQNVLEFESKLSNYTSTSGVSLLTDTHQYLGYRTNQLKQSILNKMSVFRKKLLQHRQNLSANNPIIGVSPEPYLDLDYNPFTKREWQYLSLGPSYIRPNQSALRPRKQQLIEIKNGHKDIFSKVQNNLVEYHHIPRTHAIFQEYSHELLNYLNNCYMTPLPYKDHIQAREQSQITVSIRNKIKQNKLIIRVTDKSNNFYIGSAIEFEKKAQQYFNDTDAFTELAINPLNEIMNKVTQKLNYFHSKKLILKWQYDEMLPNRTTVELAHLYFNPKTHKDNIPVRPIENTIHAPTTNISKFLDKILRPIFDDKCALTTIIDGAHLITAMKTYANKGLLKPTTFFCTFDIRNLYTMLPQDEALNILIEFLYVHGYRKVKGMALDTIRKLATIVLKDNVFVYGNKIYQQRTGGAMGSSFTLTLANIFMWKWQKEFVRRQDITGEFYGRYIDDIFITWNKSEQQLRKLLDEANQWHPNIKLEYKISRSLPFLDVLLTNHNGILLTSVYHKPAAEPYVVPFSSDHPRHTFVNIIQTSLKRAVQYSSTFEAFNDERRRIKLMLLYNGYPSSFIDQQFHKFFNEYIYATSILSFIENESQYYLLHHDILGQPTPQKSQVASRATMADVDNDQANATTETIAKESIKNIQNKPINYADRLFLHYTHEKRFHPLKRGMHHVYEKVYKYTPAMDLKLIVGNRNRRDATHELVRKRPKRSLLRCKQIKQKYIKLL
ncbi:unnamed protein product, partial [Adineta ricciae]